LERKERKKRKERKGHQGYESQNLRTPPVSDVVTDSTSSGNGLFLPHSLHGNTTNSRGN
jgi:hypothetical protein